MFDFIRSRTRAPQDAAPLDDSLDAFGSEQTSASASSRFADALKFRAPFNWRIAVLAAALIVIGGSLYQLRDRLPFMNVEAASASLTIESVPTGAEVFAAGAWQGRTPLTIAVSPGQHEFDLVHQGRHKALVADARAGAAVVHHVEFETVPETPKKASLSITTEPSKLRVTVDGVARGLSPLTVEEIDAGAHEITVAGTSGTISRKVELAAGESASVIISSIAAPARPAAAPSPAAGWLTVSAPVVLQVIEGKDIVGTSASPKIMLTAGTHQLRLANDALGFSERRVVQVRSGSTATIRVEMPTAPLSINALPWAEVWLDGVRIGETPIGNRPVTIGSHDLLFRHPEYGERRQTVTVTLTSRGRVSVDMKAADTKKKGGS
jgi:hypothetical protein